MQLVYAGIGSRSTPGNVLQDIKTIAWLLSEKKYVLRSGAAPGADTAFEIAHCMQADETGIFSCAEIYMPWFQFENRGINDVSKAAIEKKYVEYIIPSDFKACYKIVSKIHPTWNSLSQGAKKLHARNACQILGRELNDPVDFVVCWTPNGKLVGGTATALKIAKQHKIPIYNLAQEESLIQLFSIVKEHE